MADILPRGFYDRPTLDVARALLGQRLVRVLDGKRLAGPIVETEAYIGEADKANHAARGWRERHAVMYGPPGFAYVYMIYGVHHALNAVTESEGFPAAVLIRAIAPEEGVDTMRLRRGNRPLAQTADGPGKLCQALAIDLTENGVDLTQQGELFIEHAPEIPEAHVKRTPRVGVGGDVRAREALWRFVVSAADSPRA
ncbi:MAG: DNA-3-methyladenine glycosylase [Anaerolineae bacterium]